MTLSIVNAISGDRSPLVGMPQEKPCLFDLPASWEWLEGPRLLAIHFELENSEHGHSYGETWLVTLGGERVYRSEQLNWRIEESVSPSGAALLLVSWPQVPMPTRRTVVVSAEGTLLELPSRAVAIWLDTPGTLTYLP